MYKQSLAVLIFLFIAINNNLRAKVDYIAQRLAEKKSAVVNRKQCRKKKCLKLPWRYNSTIFRESYVDPVGVSSPFSPTKHDAYRLPGYRFCDDRKVFGAIRKR